MNFRIQTRGTPKTLAERCKRPMVWLGVLLAAGMSLGACNSSSSDSGSSPGTATFTWTMSANPAHFPAGAFVASAQQPATDSTCSNSAGPTTRSEAQISTPGAVALTISLPKSSFTGYYIQTVYVDMDRSHNLTTNDLVWGPLTNKFDGFCNKMGVDDVNLSFDWDTILGTGVSVWNNGAEPFSADSGIDLHTQAAEPAAPFPNIRSQEGVSVDPSLDR